MPEFGEEQQFPKRTAPYNRRMGDDPFKDVKVSCTGEAAGFLQDKLSSVEFEYDGAGRMRLKSSLYSGACSLINEADNRLVTCTANPNELTGEPNLISNGDYIEHPSFVSGFQGAKAMIDFNTGYGEFENLFVRGSLTVQELILNRLHYQCGGLIIGAGGGKIKSVTGATGSEKMLFEDPEGNNILPFTVGAIVIVQDFDLDRTTVIKRLVRQVKAIVGQEIEMEATAGWIPGVGNDDTGTFTAGDEIVAVGHVSNPNLDASIYFSAVDSGNPFMRVFDGVDSWTKWSLSGDAGKACVKYQSGNLASLANYGIVPADPGFGVYSTNAYLTGHMIISNPGDIDGSTITNDAGWTDDTAANAAQATADGKIVTFYQDNAPLGQGEAIGDLWIDTNDNNNLWRYSGLEWIDIQDGDLVQTMADVITAQDTADGKVVTFYADEPPVAEGTGDLWIDTNDGNKLYRWSGTAWVEVQDQDIVQAIADALAAQTDATAALALIPNNATGLIDFIAAPSGTGLYLGSTHLGYYDGAAWKTYMANNGDFFLGGTSGYLTWVAATNTLTISGTINSTDGNIGGWALKNTSIHTGTEHLGDGYSTAGVTFVSDGSIHAPYFYINQAGPIGLKQVEEVVFKVDGQGRGTSIVGPQIYDSEYDNDNGAVLINQYGYHGGTTRFRSTYIGNGKNFTMVNVDGPDNKIYFYSGIFINTDVVVDVYTKYFNFINGIEVDKGSGYALSLFNNGNLLNRYGLRIQCGLDVTDANFNYPVRFFDGDGDYVSSIQYNNATIGFVAISDKRLKEKIKDYNIAGLNIIDQLRYRSFNWKKDPAKLEIHGWVADEVEKIYPSMVSVDPETGYKMNTETALIPVMIAGIKELHKRLKVLEAG